MSHVFQQSLPRSSPLHPSLTILVGSGHHKKHQRLDSLNKFISPSSGGGKSNIKVVSLVASLLGLQMGTFSLCPHVVFSLWAISGVSYKDTPSYRIRAPHV